MFPNLSNTTKAFVFYGIALVLAVAAALLPHVTSMLYMLTPLVAVFLTMFVVTRDGYSRAGWAVLGLHRAGLRAWPVAVIVPLLIMGVAFGILWGSGLAQLVVPADIEGYPVAYLPLMAIPMLVTGTLTNSLGEELGWRGYLLPRLAGLGYWRAALLSGLLHGVWHLPIMLLTTLYHPDENRLIFVPLFLLAVTVGGTFFASLRFTTDSVWPASLAHTAHNLFWALFVMFTSASSPLMVEYLAGDNGLLIIIGYALAGGVLMTRLVGRAARGGSARTGALEPQAT